MFKRLLFLFIISSPLFISEPVKAESYTATGYSIGETSIEESLLLKLDIPSPLSIRGQLTSITSDKSEGVVGLTYDSSIGVYIGLGAGFKLENGGLLTEENSTSVLSIIGYEKEIIENTYIGIDYKHSFKTDDFNINTFIGFKL